MKRQLLVNIDEMDYMVDVEINCENDTTVYHVITHPSMHGYMPQEFDLVQKQDGGQLEGGPEISKLSGAGKSAVEQIRVQLEALPAQFKGGKGPGKV